MDDRQTRYEETKKARKKISAGAFVVAGIIGVAIGHYGRYSPPDCPQILKTEFDQALKTMGIQNIASEKGFVNGPTRTEKLLVRQNDGTTCSLTP